MAALTALDVERAPEPFTMSGFRKRRAMALYSVRPNLGMVYQSSKMPSHPLPIG
jgi:hypothetical protein